MTRKQRRLILIGTCATVLVFAVALIAIAYRDSFAFFYTPTELTEKNIEPNKRIRIGGLVKEGTVKRSEGTQIEFLVTDTNKSVKVSFKGILPDLFREGQGVVAEGVLLSNGTMKADTILSKHDETYQPREVVEALKKQGVWKGKDKPEK